MDYSVLAGGVVPLEYDTDINSRRAFDEITESRTLCLLKVTFCFDPVDALTHRDT